MEMWQSQVPPEALGEEPSCLAAPAAESRRPWLVAALLLACRLCVSASTPLLPFIRTLALNFGPTQFWCERVLRSSL